MRLSRLLVFANGASEPAREHSVPMFLADHLCGQSSDPSLTHGQRDATILSHGFIIHGCFDPSSNAYLMTVSDWLMSCQAWPARAR